MSTFRRVVDILGRVLIGLGVLLLLFTAYTIWGTSVQESHTQSVLRTQLQQETNSDAVRRALAQESALDKLPTGPPVAAPTTPAPAEGKLRPEDTIETSWAWEIPVAPTNRSCT